MLGEDDVTQGEGSSAPLNVNGQFRICTSSWDRAAPEGAVGASRSLCHQKEKQAARRFRCGGNQKVRSYGDAQPNLWTEHDRRSHWLTCRAFDGYLRSNFFVRPHRDEVIGRVVGEGKKLRKFVDSHHRGRQHHYEREHPVKELHVSNVAAQKKARNLITSREAPNVTTLPVRLSKICCAYESNCCHAAWDHSHVGAQPKGGRAFTASPKPRSP